jgi:hypothetical protein
MPHLKCVTCRTRYYATGDGLGPIEDLCPCCGCAFEPAGELSGLVGFRAVTADHASGTQQGLVDRLGDLLDRRAREQVHRDERWKNCGGRAIAETAARRAPETLR